MGRILQSVDLTGFLQLLDEHRVIYRIDRFRDSINVSFAVPGELWEVEFMDEGGIEIERFRSDGKIGDESWLATLVALLD